MTNEMLDGVIRALGLGEKEVDLRAASYVLCKMSAMLLAFEEEENFEEWVNALRKGRQYYIDLGIREGGSPPTVQ